MQETRLHRVIGPFDGPEMTTVQTPFHAHVSVRDAGEDFHFVVYGDDMDDAQDTLMAWLLRGKAIVGRRISACICTIVLAPLPPDHPRPAGMDRIDVEYGTEPVDQVGHRWVVTVTVEGCVPVRIAENRMRNSYPPRLVALARAKEVAAHQAAGFPASWHITINGPSEARSF